MTRDCGHSTGDDQRLRTYNEEGERERAGEREREGGGRGGGGEREEGGRERE
ncbi:unnamed protein product, partial [Staurois parvus]